MTEILNIFCSLLIFLLISSFPLNLSCYKKKTFLNKNYFFDTMSLNLLLNICVIFLISFINIDYSLYFIFVIFISIVFNLFFFFKIKNYFQFYKNEIFLFFIFLNLIIFFFLVRNPTLSWDGLENWYFKAQNFFYNFNFLDLNDIENMGYYPHFGSILWGFFWKNSLLQYEYFGRLIYIFIFLLSIFSICDLLNKNNLFKFLTVVLILLTCYDNFLFKGYQEILIFSFFIFVSKYFYIYTLDQSKNSLFICFLYLNLLPWVKNEGYLFVIIFITSLFFMIHKFPKKLEIISFIFFSCILVILKNYIYYKYLNLNLIHGGDLKFSFEIHIIKDFIIAMIIGFIVAFFKYKIWIFLIITFLLLKNNRLSQKQLNFFNFLKINLILYFVLILGIYYSVANSSQGLEWWVSNSLDRILYSISGFFIILIILLINSKRNYIVK